jgi:hypothetical protein
MGHPFKSFCQIVAVAGLFTTSSAGAVIITDSGVDTITKHFVIDSSVSTVTHDPGLVFVFGDDPPPPPQPQSYAISGSFDANFSRYWWSYYLDGDVNGTQGSFIFEQNWLTFNNANIVGDISLNGFQFPNYFVFDNGSSLFGDEGGCSFPSPPDFSCSGLSTGSISSLTGLFENGRISLQGTMFIEGGNFFENFSYNIQANAIPEPGVLILLIIGLGGLLVMRVRS